MTLWFTSVHWNFVARMKISILMLHCHLCHLIHRRMLGGIYPRPWHSWQPCWKSHFMRSLLEELMEKQPAGAVQWPEAMGVAWCDALQQDCSDQVLDGDILNLENIRFFWPTNPPKKLANKIWKPAGYNTCSPCLGRCLILTGQLRWPSNQ